MQCQHANILSIEHFARNFPSFPALYLYHIIRLRDKNGLREVVLKIHGRWFIDVEKFFRWVENQLGKRHF